MPSVESIEEIWRSGRAALDVARERLAVTSLTDNAVAAALAAIDRGNLSDTIVALAGTAHTATVADEIATAVKARDRVITLARRNYGPALGRMARSFRSSADPDDDVDRAWEKIVRVLYSWQQTGEFYAWLSAAFRSALRDGLRTSDRRVAKHRRFAEEALIQAPPPTFGGKGTTTFGNELALHAFKDSLEPDKRALWDDWARLGADDMKPEEIYATMAGSHGKSPAAIKGAVLRLVAEFKEIAGANVTGVVDASKVIALWIGSEHDRERTTTTTIVATGIDAEDRVRLLAMRQVRQVEGRVFRRMFTTLERWGLPRERRLLVVADESPGLRAAIKAWFAERALVQPCVRALLRSIADTLPAEAGHQFVKRAERAFQARTAEQAQAQLVALTAALEGSHPATACRLTGEIDAALTVKRLGLPATLEEQLTRVQFLGDRDAPSGSWLGRVFADLRQRRSIDRRREGLIRLVTALGG
jgi:DNA-directed RNA polymerase specialized sigma24 family protein